ncbi:MAG: helix-turn-helix transcriptional regulator [Chloroflexi bacterium]|nr:helix-turn-helix transcriptional regulator [Chloroflexota bacterium]
MPAPREPAEKFGRLLRAFRRKKGFSQAQLARGAGVSQGFISLLESGARRPTPGQAIVLSRSLELSVQETQKLLAAAGLPPALAVSLAAASYPATAALVKLLMGTLLVTRDEDEVEMILDDLGQRLDRWHGYRSVQQLLFDGRAEAARRLYRRIADAEAASPLDSRLRSTAAQVLGQPGEKRRSRVAGLGADHTSAAVAKLERLLADEGVPADEKRAVEQAVESLLRDVATGGRRDDQARSAERLKTVRQVVVALVHHLRNLLSPLVVYPDLIKMQMPEEHRVVVWCDAMLEAALRMNALTDDLEVLVGSHATGHGTADERQQGQGAAGQDQDA